MPDKPLLLLPRTAHLPRIKKQIPMTSHLRFPDRQDQGGRMGPQLTAMLEAFVTETPAGTSTENILVLETIGRPENFRTAVAAIPGLKWLAEVDQDDVEADARFFERPKIGARFLKNRGLALDARESREITSALAASGVIDRDGILEEDASDDIIREAIPQDYRQYAEEIVAAINKEKASPLPGRMYLSLSNRQALQEIKTLFDKWEQGGRLQYGAGAWGEIFSQLRTIRFWNVKDRMTDTGILDYWKEEVECKRGTASMCAFEIELTYEDDEVGRRRRQQGIEALVALEHGIVVASFDMKEIHFHAVKVELPIANIERVLGDDYSALFQDGGIFLFRPAPQCAVDSYADGVTEEITPGSSPEAPPVVAVLDGLPFSHHNLLDGFMIIDDEPDHFAEHYQPRDMNHGTAMLSLICHGELDGHEGPITHKVYVRPILCPDPGSPLRRERIPKDVFFEDLVERAIRKMFAGVAGEPPSAPGVKIINLSVADPDRMFHRFPGPTARLLDWLSYKYKVLFCVSAGNVKDTIQLGMDPVEFSAISDDEKVAVALKSLYGNRRNRRILAPSESINSLTVGALHDDTSVPIILGDCLDILPSQGLPSPLSPFGHGFRSSIKPEIVVPGGRQFFMYSGDGEYDLPKNIAPRSGQKVAAAPVLPGDRTRITYTCGTSNANALAVRGASFIYDAVLEILDEHEVDNADDSIAALIKALMVHGASWGSAGDAIENAVLNGKRSTEVKKELARCLGYGRPDFAKSIECTATRATAIGFSAIAKDQRHEYQLPLPPSLSGLDCWRRLTVTLAWLSPISVDNRKYRKAALAFDATETAAAIGGQRVGAQWQQVKNGTIQHEIFEGKEVRAFQKGECLIIPVQCREDAGTLDVDVPYGLTVSLEVREEVDIPLYEEIKDLIEVPVREAVRAV